MSATDRTHGVIRVSTTVPLTRIDVAPRRPADGRKRFVIAAALSVLLMPAQTIAQPDVPVESVIGNDQANAVGVPFRPASRGNSTGTATQQILESIRHWKQAAPVVDGITAPANATVPAERLTPPAPAVVVDESVEQIIRDVWPDELEDRAVKIAFRESRFVPTAHNSICYGIFQIYFSVHRDWLADFGVNSPSDLYDPRVNATVALALYLKAGWTPWQT